MTHVSGGLLAIAVLFIATRELSWQMSDLMVPLPFGLTSGNDSEDAMGGWKKEGGGKPHEGHSSQNRLWNPRRPRCLVRFLPPEVSLRCFFCRSSCTEIQDSVRCWVHFPPPIHFAPPHIMVQMIAESHQHWRGASFPTLGWTNFCLTTFDCASALVPVALVPLDVVASSSSKCSGHSAALV